MKDIEYYMNLKYRMEIIEDQDEGGYVAYYPELPGCMTCAETVEETITELQDAKREWITAMLEDGMDIAEPDGKKCLLCNDWWRELSLCTAGVAPRVNRDVTTAYLRG
jgi:predicted RNase H-like HicB family nuclease